MKSHELARALRKMSGLLLSGPNVELDDLSFSEQSQLPMTMPEQELAVGLGTLAALSRVDKSQWVALINEYDFPVDVRPRDASRDVIGKLLRFLEKNPRAVEMLVYGSHTRQNTASPELMRALGVLLKS